MSMYVTVQEFKNAPTGIDTYGLIPGGTQQQNDAELYNILVRASSWADRICNQTLEASQNTEIKEVTINNSGLLRIHPNMSPIISLLEVEYRINPMGPWVPIPLTSIQAFSRYFTSYDLNSMGISPALALQYPTMGYRTPQRMRNIQKVPLMVKYTYVNGYTNTYLQTVATAGQTSITLVSNLGVTPGQSLTIYDSERTESVTIQAINGNVATLSTPLLFDHVVNTPISALPAAVKQAVILLASYLIKERGALTISMNETSLQGISRYKDATDVDIAKELLEDFRRGLVS